VLEQHTMTDPLTGLGNRRALGEWMRRRSAEATVAILDLDHFKRFNDTHGHLDGDALLRRFGNVLQAHLRAEDCAVRLGGEEFCIALDRADVHVAERYVARVRTAFASDDGRVTFSAGIAVVGPAETPEQALRRADEALYEAKRTGRDRTVRAGS
jgi:diguanylate cyclase (GGDEF)-like protein